MWDKSGKSLLINVKRNFSEFSSWKWMFFFCFLFKYKKCYAHLSEITTQLVTKLVTVVGDCNVCSHTHNVLIYVFKYWNVIKFIYNFYSSDIGYL